MKTSIFRSIYITVISVLFAVLILTIGVLYSYFISVQQSGMKTQTELIAKAVEAEGIAYIERLTEENYRITYISPDGSVLYDTQGQTDSMQNHLDREEVKKALETGYGESYRYSDTLLERDIYSAKRLEDGSIVRLSSGHLTLLSLILKMVPYVLVISIFAVVLSLILASRLSVSIVRPLNELNLDHPGENKVYEELHPLLARIDSQQRQLKRQSDQIRHKQDEFNAATADMREGLLILNNSGIILSINHVASRLLSIDDRCVGQNIFQVESSSGIQNYLAEAEQGQASEIKTQMNGREYQIRISPILSDRKISGVAILIFDITDQEHAEQMRREFTSNVSHELKTPLHSISGYAELLKNGLVRPGDADLFYERIYSEAQRMIDLVEDIIRLSHLDEGAEDLPREDIDLYEMAEETKEILAAEAEEAGVHIELAGEHAMLYGCRQLISGIFFNLCDNAIKYNRQDGKVYIEIQKEAEEVRLSVADTGIGIPAEHHDRIFERFYRVDKSHSKAVGGTGLGLSIVKHAAMLHHARIEVESQAGKGTRIMVHFPT